MEGSWWERKQGGHRKFAVTELQFADDVAVLGSTREEIETCWRKWPHSVG